nr:RES domain-containing protein [uncultured Flavobacterium sp.]
MTTSKNKEIALSPSFDIPLKQDEDDIIQFLEKVFKIYLDNIGNFDGGLKEALEKQKDRISNLTKGILDSLRCYLDGNIIKSYNILETELNNIKDLLAFNYSKTAIGPKGNFEEFYRARLGSERLFSKEEMFHIPFEKRYLVNNQRYSLSGLPCLYLANSTYLCWEELGRPDFDKLQFSRYDLSKSDFKLLNLNLTMNAIAPLGFDNNGEMNEMADFLVVKHIATWPLQAASSIIVKNINGSFKPEYIIPQLILQWITNTEDIDGIRYFSTKHSGTTPVMFFGNLANVVIPIKKSNHNGLCDTLKKKIELTSPISYEYAQLINPKLVLDELNSIEITDSISMKPFTLNLFGESKTFYANTKFGQLERILHKFPNENLN